LICHQDHYFVAVVVIDPKDELVFSSVVLYDSLGSRSGVTKKCVTPKSRCGQYLLTLQNFVAEFVFHKNKAVYDKLTTDKRLIIRLAEHHTCPTQQNIYDCSLFGLGNMLHVINGITIDNTSYNQEDISRFRISRNIAVHTRVKLWNANVHRKKGAGPCLTRA
jgi:Ulp1 family protease